MTHFWNEVLKSQFIAAIDMLKKPIQDCPAELWNARLWNNPHVPLGFADFWYIAYHTLFWTDLYLSGAVAGFVPPAPFDLNELDPQGRLPEKTITKDDLLGYLDHCRKKCLETIEKMDDGKSHQLCEFPWSKGEITYAELQLDNMRHVQEHAAQLNMFLGQHAEVSSSWVG